MVVWRTRVWVVVLVALAAAGGLPGAGGGEPAAADEVVDHVVGGEIQSVGFEHAVSLLVYKGKWVVFRDIWSVCTGSIVAPHWVLTAAHCVEGHDASVPIEITFGSTNRTLGSVAQADQIAIAPGYRSESRSTGATWPDVMKVQFPLFGDLALVHTPTVLGEGIELVSSAHEPDWDGSQNAVVAGWGRTAIEQTDRLHAASVTVSPDSVCAEVFGKDFTVGGELCTAVAGPAACTGDSGGPLTATDRRGRAVLMGVISSGDAYCRGVADYTRVSAYRGWIDETIGTGEHADGDGYWLFNDNGDVRAFGGAVYFGLHPHRLWGGLVDVAADPNGKGFWAVSGGGRIEGQGYLSWAPEDVERWPHGLFIHLEDHWPYNEAAKDFVPPTDELYTSIAVTPTGHGLWLFTNQGRVITLGDAQPFPANGQTGAPSDLTHLDLNGPIIDAAATPTGLGYYLVGSDGGVFTFGDAHFVGSMGGHHLNQPVIGLVPDSDGDGYWLVGSDGGVFAFNAPFRGSLGSLTLNKPIVGMVPHGNGYLMVGSDGGAFNFSNLPFYGSTGNNPSPHPVFAIASSTPT